MTALFWAEYIFNEFYLIIEVNVNLLPMWFCLPIYFIYLYICRGRGCHNFSLTNSPSSTNMIFFRTYDCLPRCSGILYCLCFFQQSCKSSIKGHLLYFFLQFSFPFLRLYYCYELYIKKHNDQIFHMWLVIPWSWIALPMTSCWAFSSLKFVEPCPWLCPCPRPYPFPFRPCWFLILWLLSLLIE